MYKELNRWLDIDIDESLMIGDSKRDLQFANKCGIKYKSIDHL